MFFLCIFVLFLKNEKNFFLRFEIFYVFIFAVPEFFDVFKTLAVFKMLQLFFLFEFFLSSIFFITLYFPKVYKKYLYNIFFHEI